jgi:hypothetical protein
MLAGLKCEGDFDGLVNQLGNAALLTANLIRHVISDACMPQVRPVSGSAICCDNFA